MRFLHFVSGALFEHKKAKLHWIVCLLPNANCDSKIYQYAMQSRGGMGGGVKINVGSPKLAKMVQPYWHRSQRPQVWAGPCKSPHTLLLPTCKEEDEEAEGECHKTNAHICSQAAAAAAS